jgi:ketosteroid isomerase-like protein
MTTQEVGQKLVELCNQGKHLEAVQTLYGQDIVSVEPMPMPDGSREISGMEAIIGKLQWWESEHEVHSGKAEGPLAAGNHFCVRFTMDITHKPSGKRMTMDELGVYRVKDGKIVREEFFYPS